MREYRTRTISEVVASTCNRCQRRLSSDEPGEWQERLSFDHFCGFDSVFGDGSMVSIDLCQHCVQEVLGQWLRITKSADIGGTDTLAQVLMNMPNVGKDADFVRNPRDMPREPKTKYETPIKPVDAAQKARKGKQKGS
ncbi:hypothetical protein [Ralstonia wenshanensis]|uniref:hypothetical protein n=1 Tax=Ralstonia wenshanensis TaxID=2842456 RepID=UPI0021B32974|nr:hypothetical protein [Ralstonia wenshanensis]MCT7306222.1 hypothetical protein [Ralstonia wenshanensis]